MPGFVIILQFSLSLKSDLFLFAEFIKLASKNVMQLRKVIVLLSMLFPG